MDPVSVLPGDLSEALRKRERGIKQHRQIDIDIDHQRERDTRTHAQTVKIESMTDSRGMDQDM